MPPYRAVDANWLLIGHVRTLRTLQVVLVALAIVVFGRGMRGPAVAVTVADDTVVRWLAGLHAPGWGS